MIIRRGFRFRLKVDNMLHRRLIGIAGCCRFVWNKALALNLGRLAGHVPILRYAELCRMLVLWKQSDEFGFLKDAPSQALQQKLRDLDRAFGEAFAGRRRMPRYKRKGKDDSFRFPQGVKVQGNRVFLPTIGWVRFFKSREIVGRITQATVIREADGWYISFQTEVESASSTPRMGSAVGIDRGVAVFAATSDGELIDPVHAFARAQRRLARLQRQLARKRKGSANWRKQAARIARLHLHIRRVRDDFLHTLSTRLSKNHALVVVEKLPIQNMTRSARGTASEPGIRVAAKRGLNRAILDQGWGLFERMLEYKLAERGGELRRVPAAGSSQECSACGHRDSANRESRGLFVCRACGHTEHADGNAAKVILARGME
jgi:putative transposase